MPASSRSKPAAENPDEGRPVAGAPDDEGPADQPAATDQPETEDVPLNRAARRAKGRGKGQAQAYGPSKVSGGKGPAQGPRMWANRRSG